ncbi:hypothetical protein GCM10028777_10660 [Angustibacter speluncae]
MAAEQLQQRIDEDASAGGRFRALPAHLGVDDTRTEEIVDQRDDPEDRRLWWAALQKALHDG